MAGLRLEWRRSMGNLFVSACGRGRKDAATGAALVEAGKALNQDEARSSIVRVYSVAASVKDGHWYATLGVGENAPRETLAGAVSFLAEAVSRTLGKLVTSQPSADQVVADERYAATVRYHEQEKRFAAEREAKRCTPCRDCRHRVDKHAGAGEYEPGQGYRAYGACTAPGCYCKMFKAPQTSAVT